MSQRLSLAFFFVMNDQNGTSYSLSIIIEDYEALKSARMVRCAFHPNLTVQEAIEKIAKRNNVLIPEKDISLYRLRSTKIRFGKKKFPMSKTLEEVAQSGVLLLKLCIQQKETLILKKKSTQQVILQVVVEDYEELQMAMSISHIFKKSDTVQNVIEYIANRGGPDLLKNKDNCVLFSPSMRSKKGYFMEPERTLGFFRFPRGKKVNPKLANTHISIPLCLNIERKKKSFSLFELTTTKNSNA